MSAIKAKVENAASSAKAGTEKAMAAAGEKVEKATTRDPMKKREAEERKLEIESDERVEKAGHGPEKTATRTVEDRSRP
ncbi:protein LE25-like [Panicum virgatum]|uniref:Uncharacterized protein n=1 Tax=Panicum virgatum TaxID=38727 RepID=A0A8T0T3U7_PANVG|nr:protein LE25-like [Panicum virgatum]KAG2605730.1 hypothetical protein PVAP13_4NG136800 [Panicum virgatum]